MDIQALCPLRVAAFIWQPSRGRHAMTVVCKGTFDLAPIASTLAEHQEDLNERDNHWDDDPARSLYSPSDMAPMKPRADVLLVGHAFAPRGEPASSLIARLVIAEVDKSVEVISDRAFTQGGVLREGARFMKMPLRYERAAAGADNPVGVRADAANAYGSIALPNLMPPGLVVNSPSEHVPPTGFGPIAPNARSRAERLGPHAGKWPSTDWAQRPIPEEISPTYFNVAPHDQQVDAIRSDERIVLENLHPDIPRLVTNLPGLRPVAFIEKAGKAPHEITLSCDTLWIDTDRAICALTWRGQIPLEHPSEVGRVLVAMAKPGQRLAWTDVEQLERAAGSRDDPWQSATARLSLDKDDERNMNVAPSDVARLRAALPFLHEGAPPPPPSAPAPHAPPPASRSRGTLDMPNFAATRSSATRDVAPAWLSQPSPQRAPDPAAPLAAMSAATAAPPPPIAPPPFAPPAIAPHPMAPPPSASPWAAGAPPAPPLGASAHAPLKPALWQAPSSAPSTAAQSGAVAASNAAAAAAASAIGPLREPEPPKQAVAPVAAQASPVKSSPREYLDLLWFDSGSIRRIRAHKPFADALVEPEQGDWIDDDDRPWKPAVEASERTDVLRVLARVKPLSADEVLSAIAAAIDEDRAFSPPLVVVTGELEITFDEIETLKAHVSAASPLAAADKKLRDAIDAANEALRSAWPPAGGLAEGFTSRIKEAVAQAGRSLPHGYIESFVERALLEHRRFQRRIILGQSRLRCLLTTAPGASPIPVYLPESLASHLPMFQRFRVTVAAEAQGQQDQYESHPVALLALALGRLLPVPTSAQLKAAATR